MMISSYLILLINMYPLCYNNILICCSISLQIFYQRKKYKSPSNFSLCYNFLNMLNVCLISYLTNTHPSNADLQSIETNIFHFIFHLTLILLTAKVISLCHQYRARPACTSVDLKNSAS